jgi:hypothetical protein
VRPTAPKVPKCNGAIVSARVSVNIGKEFRRWDMNLTLEEGKITTRVGVSNPQGYDLHRKCKSQGRKNPKEGLPQNNGKTDS